MARPVFTRNDVNEARDHLVRLLRLIFYTQGITHDDFVRLHTAYWRRSGKEESGVNTHRNNLRRRLLQIDGVTFKAFQFVLTEILRMNIESFTVTLVDRETGETKTFDSMTVLPKSDEEGAATNGTSYDEDYEASRARVSPVAVDWTLLPIGSFPHVRELAVCTAPLEADAPPALALASTSAVNDDHPSPTTHVA